MNKIIWGFHFPQLSPQIMIIELCKLIERIAHNEYVKDRGSYFPLYYKNRIMDSMASQWN